MASSLQQSGWRAWPGPSIGSASRPGCSRQQAMRLVAAERRNLLQSGVQLVVTLRGHTSVPRAAAEDSSVNFEVAEVPAGLAGKGAAIAELFREFRELVEAPCGSSQAVAEAGDEVLINVKREVANLEGADQQLTFEILRLVRLLEMDLILLRAAQKEATLTLRLDSARSHSRQASQLVSLL